MLDYFKLYSYVPSIHAAVLASMEDKNVHTLDIGGQGTTLDIIHSIINHVSTVN